MIGCTTLGAGRTATIPIGTLKQCTKERMDQWKEEPAVKAVLRNPTELLARQRRAAVFGIAYHSEVCGELEQRAHTDR